MKKLRVTIVDLIARGPSKAVYARVMNANLASIMPQVIGVWCEQEGHEVRFVCYTGFEDLLEELPDDVDLRLHRRVHRGRAARLCAEQPLPLAAAPSPCSGGPHARCYPEDAAALLRLRAGLHRRRRRARRAARLRAAPAARACTSRRRSQPRTLPGVRERWQFIEPTLTKAPLHQDRADARQPGLPLHLQLLHRLDGALPAARLRKPRATTCGSCCTKMKRPLVGWHDPNFGVRFDDYMDAIEEAVPPGSIDFIAESSLSLLSEPHLKRLQAQRLQGAAARHRVVVRPGQQVEDRTPARHGQGPPGVRPREHDPALHPVRADELRAGTGLPTRARSRSS